MYNFNVPPDRKQTNSFKWDAVSRKFGRDGLLPFWVADMDFPVAPSIIEALERRLSHPVFGYTFPPESAIQAVVTWLTSRHEWAVGEETVSFIPGVIPGLVAALYAFTEPGDRILIQTPVYHPFYDVIKSNSRTLVENPLVETGGYYSMDVNLLEDQLKEGVKLLFLCNPHNPVGRVWKKEELKALSESCARYGTIVVSDEIHCDIVYPGAGHLPFPLADKKSRDRVIVLGSASKTFNIPGLCTAFAVIPDVRLRRRFTAVVRQHALGMTNLFGPAALEAAFTGGVPWLEQLLLYLEKNVDTALSMLRNGPPGIRVVKPEGTFLLWIDFRDLSLSPGELKEILIEKGGLAMSDGREFGSQGEGFQRMNIGCSRRILEEGLDRLCRCFGAL